MYMIYSGVPTGGGELRRGVRDIKISREDWKLLYAKNKTGQVL